ncbi:MAG: succinate dehydrogenase, hydrophobic membrane anchor protein [Burkholderiaceae bacterium]
MMAANIGSKRLVTGARYGLRDWLGQRVSAVILAVYAIVLGGYALFAPGLNYEQWAGLFAPTWMKVFTLLALFSLFFHAWIGIRDIWMDYVKSVAVRLTLHVLTILWLLGCAIGSVQILWRV